MRNLILALLTFSVGCSNPIDMKINNIIMIGERGCNLIGWRINPIDWDNKYNGFNVYNRLKPYDDTIADINIHFINKKNKTCSIIFNQSSYWDKPMIDGIVKGWKEFIDMDIIGTDYIDSIKQTRFYIDKHTILIYDTLHSRLDFKHVTKIKKGWYLIDIK